MASDNPWKRLQEEATCSICWKYYDDPCILDCGHSFCQACVSQCWEEFPETTACPQCRTVVERIKSCPNTPLTKVVEIAKQLNSQVKVPGEGELVCKEHPEPFRVIFCVSDQVLFCQACEGSKRHRDHQVASVEETALLYQNWYSNYIRALKVDRANMVQHKFCLKEWDEKLQKHSIAERQTIAAGFKQLYDFLKNQEDCLLQQVESVPREIAEKTNNHNLVANLCLDTFIIENNIRKLEEKASQPVLKFLQDGMMTFNRCLKTPRLLILEGTLRDLKWGVWEVTEMSATVEGIASYVKGLLQNTFSVTRASVTLDTESCNPRLHLAPDGTGVKWNYKVGRCLSNSPKRFDKLCCVVGCQEFTIGRHFWEVMVEGEGEWAVGVAKRSVQRKGFFHLSPTEGVFAVGKLDHRYRVIDVPGSPILPLEKELRWIRVSLNCSAGEVNFYDVRRALRIHRITGIGCFQETFLPFFWLNKDTQLVIINQ